MIFLNLCYVFLSTNLASSNIKFFIVSISGLLWLEEESMHLLPQLSFCGITMKVSVRTKSDKLMNIYEQEDTKQSYNLSFYAQMLSNLYPYGIQQAHHRRSSFQGTYNNTLPD